MDTDEPASVKMKLTLRLTFNYRHSLTLNVLLKYRISGVHSSNSTASSSCSRDLIWNFILLSCHAALSLLLQARSRINIFIFMQVHTGEQGVHWDFIFTLAAGIHN